MHTRPTARLRQPERQFDITREGLGDFRTTKPGRYGESTHVQGEGVYRPLRNGLPEEVPYVYRAPGWRDRVKRAGLDLDAIREADESMDPRPWLRPRAVQEARGR